MQSIVGVFDERLEDRVEEVEVEKGSRVEWNEAGEERKRRKYLGRVFNGGGLASVRVFVLCPSNNL